MAGSLFNVLYVAFLTLPLLSIAQKKEEEKPLLAEKVLGLRESLGNKWLIPLAGEQPVPLGAEELPLVPTHVGPVRRWKANMVAIAIVIVLLLSIDASFAYAAIEVFPYTPWASLPLGVLALFFTLLVLLVFIAAGRSFRSHNVIVDAWGLRWTAPVVRWRRPATVVLDWQDINGFYMIRGQDDPGKFAKVYVLDSPRGMFYWPVFERSRPQEQQASAYLTRLVTAQTHLPLRDLTNAVEPLLSSSPDSSIEEKEMKLIFAKSSSKKQ